MTPLSALDAIPAGRGARFVATLPTAPPFAAESTVYADCGCPYHHDFLHDPQGRVVVDDTALADVRAKMLHKWESCATAVGRAEEVLFVHLGSHRTHPIAWPYLVDADTLAGSRINRLQRMLAATFPAPRCRLLQIHYAATTPFHADEPPADPVQVRALSLTLGASWQDEAAAWDRLLDGLSTPSLSDDAANHPQA